MLCGIGFQPLIGTGVGEAGVLLHAVCREDVGTVAGGIFAGLRRRLDGRSPGSGLFLRAAGLPVALDRGLIGALAGGGILIPCRQHQLYLILLCGLGHLAVGCGGLGFQRNAGGIIGHSQLRRRLFRQGKVCIHQYEALIRKVRLRAALILPGLEGRRRCDEGIGPGQQPEDAAGHHSHDRTAAEQKDRPVAHEADTVSPAAFFRRQSAAGCGSILLHDAASFLFLTFALDTGT